MRAVLNPAVQPQPSSVICARVRVPRILTVAILFEGSDHDPCSVERLSNLLIVMDLTFVAH